MVVGPASSSSFFDVRVGLVLHVAAPPKDGEAGGEADDPEAAAAAVGATPAQEEVVDGAP